MHLHPAFTLESLGVGVVSGEGERCQGGRRRPAGPGGVTQLCLEVSVGGRTWARLSEEARGVCVQRNAFRLRSLHGRVPEITSRAEADQFCDDLCRISCSHRAELRAAEMDGGWEGGGEEG